MSRTRELEFQSRLGFGISQRTQDNQRSLESIQDIPKDALNTFLVVDWFNAIAQFRNLEIDHLCQDDSPHANSQEHRVALSQLIAQGETFILAIQQNGLVKNPGFTVDDIRATIESLRDTFRGVHGPHNHPQTTSRILDILSAA